MRQPGHMVSWLGRPRIGYLVCFMPSVVYTSDVFGMFYSAEANSISCMSVGDDVLHRRNKQYFMSVGERFRLESGNWRSTRYSQPFGVALQNLIHQSWRPLALNLILSSHGGFLC